MKRTCAIALVFALMLPMVWSAQAQGLDRFARAKPMLVTAYRQVGWDDAIQVGYVDERGGLWFLKGYDHDLNWPYSPAEQLAWISSAKGFTSLGTLSWDDLFALDSLVQCVENQGSQRTPAANDAGTETSYAVQYTEDEPQIILLGVSGDDRFENTDATAQALYRFMRESFPGVTSYFGKSSLMAPAGFQSVSLLDFCGYNGLDLDGLLVERTDVDCEASVEPVRLSTGEADELRDRIARSRVTGKYGCISVTGGSTIYAFLDASGQIKAQFEFYHDHLVLSDGMYMVERLP